MFKHHALLPPSSLLMSELYSRVHVYLNINFISFCDFVHMFKVVRSVLLDLNQRVVYLSCTLHSKVYTMFYAKRKLLHQKMCNEKMHASYCLFYSF